MQTISLQTRIAAPPERCFLLSLSVDLHKESTTQTKERVIAGVTNGVMGPGQTVTWRGRHFGVMLTQETVISAYERPRYFQDRMTRGVFKSFVHDHFFTATQEGTLMVDELSFEAPMGLFGRIAESLILRSYLVGFLQQRNDYIRSIAESATRQWQQYVDE